MNVTSLLVKLAMRCNIACTYCYWFRDPGVYDKPSLMQDEVAAALVRRIESHVLTNALPTFSIIFHGGEPLLYGIQRFDRLAGELREVEARTGCRIAMSVMSNGILLTETWLEVLHRHNVRLGISIDGPKEVHDARRIDFHGEGTLGRVEASLDLARRSGFEVGVLSVCNPESDPEALLTYLVDTLGLTAFDVLVPDLTHDNAPVPSIADFYIRLFDLWYDRYAAQGIEIRYVNAMLQGLLGGRSGSIVMGTGAVSAVTVLTDGALEALDTMRAVGAGVVRSALNILDHPLDAIAADPLWSEILHASEHLPAKCQACKVQAVCGGGPIVTRWSRARRFDNPTVYCPDKIKIISHVWTRIRQDLFVELGEIA